MPTTAPAQDKNFQRALQPVETALAALRRQIDALPAAARSDIERAYKAIETKIEGAKKEAGTRGQATLKAADKLVRDLSASTAKRAELQRRKDEFEKACRKCESDIERFAAGAGAVRLSDIRKSIEAQVRDYRAALATARAAEPAKGLDLLAALAKRVDAAMQAMRNVRETETHRGHFEHRAAQVKKALATLRDSPAKKGLTAALDELEFDSLGAAMRLDIAGLKEACQEANFIHGTVATVHGAVEDVEREFALIAAALRKAGNPAVPSETLRSLTEHYRRGWPRSQERESIRREVIAFRSAVERFAQQVREELKKAPAAAAA